MNMTQEIPVGFGQSPLFNTTNLLLLGATLVSLLVLAGYSANTKQVAKKDGLLEIQTAPGWRPVFIGHLFDMINANKLLRSTRDKVNQGIFSITVMGASVPMIYAPSLVSTIFSQRPTVVDFNDIVWRFLQRVGKASNKSKAKWYAAFQELVDETVKCMMREPGLTRMVDAYMANFFVELPNMMSWLPSGVDHSLWERQGKATLVSEPGAKPVMEANLVELIIYFVGTNAQVALMGKDFEQKNPNALTDMFEFNHFFEMLVLGLPDWLPLPSLRSALKCRDRLLAGVTKWNDALTADSKGESLPHGYNNVDDVSTVMQTRTTIQRRYGLDSEEGSVGDLVVMWALHANANFACFWVLARICADPELLAAVRAEIAPHVTITKNEGGNGELPGQPQINIDHKAIGSQCPLLKACFIECMRIDSQPWSLRKVLKDFHVSENKAEAAHFGLEEPRSWVVRKGGFAVIPFDVHFTDPRYWEDPAKFVPERHIKYKVEPASGEEKKRAEWTSVRPFGGGVSMCKGRMFAEREVTTTVAGLISMYDFEPVDGVWNIPEGGKATGVNVPKSDIRVKISKRGEW